MLLRLSSIVAAVERAAIVSGDVSHTESNSLMPDNVLSLTSARNLQVCALSADPSMQSATKLVISCGSSACSCAVWSLLMHSVRQITGFRPLFARSPAPFSARAGAG